MSLSALTTIFWIFQKVDERVDRGVEPFSTFTRISKLLLTDFSFERFRSEGGWGIVDPSPLWVILRTLNENGTRSSMGCMMFGKKVRVGTSVPLCTPTTAALTCGIRVGQEGFRRACGAGMIRGRMHVQDALRA